MFYSVRNYLQTLNWCKTYTFVYLLEFVRFCFRDIHQKLTITIYFDLCAQRRHGELVLSLFAIHDNLSLQELLHLRPNHVGRLATESLNLSRFPVEIDQRLCELSVHLKTMLDRFRFVVFTLHQRFAGHIVAERNAWTVESGVVDPATGQMHPTTFDPVDYDLVRNVQVNHKIYIVRSLQIVGLIR